MLSNTNIPPYQAMEENKLRRDLFYRLGVVNITIPPLRERKEDIPLLVKTFIMQCNRKLERNIREADRMCWMCFMHMTGRTMCGNKYI